MADPAHLTSITLNPPHQFKAGTYALNNAHVKRIAQYIDFKPLS